jgi:hypothetical protein
MTTRLALLIWALGSLLFLVAVEVLDVLLGRPTISEDLQALNDAAPVFGISICVLAGILLDHFFGGARR